MILPSPSHSNYSNLVNDIERGRIKIPQFQREFVWSMQKSAALMDSILKGYPIGAFIFWSTKERLRAVRNIGKVSLPDARPGEIVSFVLDGQQRLTSLYATVTGAQISRESGSIDDFGNVVINLDAGEHDDIVSVTAEKETTNQYVSVTKLLQGDLRFLASFPERYHSRISEYKRRISSYDFSIVEVRDVELDVATEIFTRINVGGKPLTVFEIMVAKTYDENRGFDLSSEFQKVISRLVPIDYETIPDITLLQLVAALVTGECDKRAILSIEKSKFIDMWPTAVDALERAVEYFRNTYRIPVSRLLPYNSLLIPFSYFFFKHPDKPDAQTHALLQDFFWRCSLGGRYSSSQESKLGQDIKKIDQFLAGKTANYDWAVDVTPDFLSENGWFSANRAFIKAILCLFTFHEPKSFSDNSIVNVRNHWLKQANSRNYHHFFPKSYLDGKQDYFYINHIVNITIVDDYLNKREIGARPPSKYMAKFRSSNSQLQKTMATHLIGDLDDFGITNNDYDTFFEKRSAWIASELSSRVIRQKIDDTGQVSLAQTDDADEADVVF